MVRRDFAQIAEALPQILPQLHDALKGCPRREILNVRLKCPLTLHYRLEFASIVYTGLNLASVPDHSGVSHYGRNFLRAIGGNALIIREVCVNPWEFSVHYHGFEARIECDVNHNAKVVRVAEIPGLRPLRRVNAALCPFFATSLGPESS